MAWAGTSLLHGRSTDDLAQPAHTINSLPPAALALIFGLLSALSLPVGAALGLLCSPVNPFLVANIISFGAGCLIFAVTIELYGDQLMHLHRSEYQGTMEIGICLTSALFGSLMYIYLNRWVEGFEEEQEDETTPRGEVSGGEATPESAERGEAPASEQTPLVPEPPHREHTKSSGSSAAKRWGRVRLAVKFTKLKVPVNLRHGTAGGEGNARTLALGMLAGIIADGIPEAILIGFLASEGHLSLMFVVSLFIANFPESFSSASLMAEGGLFPWYTIIAMWTFPCVMTGLLAGLACWAIPPWAHATLAVRVIAAIIEGLAGGMMLTMISSVMLPQAFNMAKESAVWNPWKKADGKPDAHHGGDVPGVLCVCGFLCAVGLKVMGGVLGSAH